MSEIGTPSFEQLRVFRTVAEAGSFAAAARTLGRATSAVAYAVGNLEQQLGVALFAREGTRRPVLTEAGRMVLAEARILTQDMDTLRARVLGLRRGLEREVQVALDVMLPTERVADALTAFAAEFPSVTLRLHVEALGAVPEMVLAGRADLGVMGPQEIGGDALARIGVGQVELVPVAAPGHPLALARRNPPGAGRAHVQLVLTDRSRLTEGWDFAVMATRTWRLADLGAKHLLLREGIGWGNMPLPMVREDLEAGRLVRLDMPELRGGTYHLNAIHRMDRPPGPAAAWLVARFEQQAAALAAPPPGPTLPRPKKNRGGSNGRSRRT
ncbi:LysR family transcriptional regulator [Roseococcus sp. YIM B11640]|uniref:LysR family transcriptional regulator n=1 Tax=Roseococcus sp. YIM B11640 TaxID=3133973 RepID=UPI003C79FC51